MPAPPGSAGAGAARCGRSGRGFAGSPGRRDRRPCGGVGYGAPPAIPDDRKRGTASRRARRRPGGSAPTWSPSPIASSSNQRWPSDRCACAHIFQLTVLIRWITDLGNILITCGLALDIIGAVILTTTIMSKEEAAERGAIRYMPKPGDPEIYKVPAVAGFIRDTKRARIGLSLLILGFFIQIWGFWAG